MGICLKSANKFVFIFSSAKISSTTVFIHYFTISESINGFPSIHANRKDAALALSCFDTEFVIVSRPMERDSVKESIVYCLREDFVGKHNVKSRMSGFKMPS